MKFRVKDPSATLEADAAGVTLDYQPSRAECVFESGQTLTIDDWRGVSVYFDDIRTHGPLISRGLDGDLHEGTASIVEVQLDHISPMLYDIMTGNAAPEGSDQMPSHITTVRAELDAARAAVSRAERALQAAENQLYPKQPAAASSVVRFSRTPRGSHTSYDYAAIKANSRWFTTGATCPVSGFTWKELIDWIRDGGQWSPLQVMVATGGDKLRLVKL